MPAYAQKASVGPLSTCPPTNGLTATTGAGAARTASRMAGTARIGAIDAIGFDGPITTASASRSAPSTCSVGRACSAPSNSTLSIGPRAPSTIMNSWKRERGPARAHARAYGLVGWRAGRWRATPMASTTAAWAAVALCPAAISSVRIRHMARSRSPRRNHVSRPAAASASMTCQVSPAMP